MLIRYGVNSAFASPGCAKNCVLASSAVLRRQQFLIRSLGGYNNLRRTQEIKSMSTTEMEADAENVLREIIPVLDPNRHKGQAGNLKSNSKSVNLLTLFPFNILKIYFLIVDMIISDYQGK